MTGSVATENTEIEEDGQAERDEQHRSSSARDPEINSG